MGSKTEPPRKSTNLMNNTQDTCLVCAKLITIKLSLSSSSNESEEALRNIAKLLQVSPSIYDGTDFDTLPVPLLCTSCSVTIIEAVKLQEAVTVLQDRLKVLTSNVKQALVRSFDLKHLRTSYSTDEELGQVERIRKIYAQCWTPCEIRLVDCVERYTAPTESSVQSHQLNLSLQSSISESHQLGSNGLVEELELDEQSNFSEHEDAGGWEDGDPSGVNTISTHSVPCEVSADPLSEIVRQNVVECDRCGQVFHNRLDLNQHQSICPSRNSFEEFKSVVRMPTNPRKCHRCGKVFTRILFLRRHLNRKVPCTETESQQSSRVTKQSVNSITKDPQVPPQLTRFGNPRRKYRTGKCHICGKVFTTVRGLQIHLNRQTPCTMEQTDTNTGFSSTSDYKGSVKCHRCGEKFSKTYNLRVHLMRKNPCHQTSIKGSSVTMKRPEGAKCQRCGKMFARKYVLKLHLMRKVPCTDINSTTSNSNQDPIVETSTKYGFSPTNNQCYRCGKYFEKSVLLQLHLSMKVPCNQHNDDEKPELNNPRNLAKVDGNNLKKTFGYIPRKCHLCGKIFSGVNLLRNHLSRKVPCTEHQANYPLTKDLESELVPKSKEIPRTSNKCHRCGQVFTQAHRLRSHLNRISPCNLLGDVTKHIGTNSAFSTKPNLNKSIKCQRCGEMFARRYNLQLHLMRKNPCNRPIGQSFTNLGSTTRRSRYDRIASTQHASHSPVQPLNIQVDEKLFNPEMIFSETELSSQHEPQQLISDNLKIQTGRDDSMLVDERDQILTEDHKYVVTDEQPQIIAEINPEIMITNQGQAQASLSQGIPYRQITSDPNIVSDSQKWSCPQCPKTFSSSTRLSSHIGAHNRRFYTCRICSETFATYPELRFHKEQYHKISANSSLKGMRFECKQCDKSYRSGRALREHVLGVHTNFYTCVVCSRSFSSHSDLVRHKPCGLSGLGLTDSTAGETYNLHENSQLPQPSDGLALHSEESFIRDSIVDVNNTDSLPPIQSLQFRPQSTIPIGNLPVSETDPTGATDYQLPEYEEPSLLSEIQSGIKIEILQETNPWPSDEHHDGIPQIVNCTSFQP